MGRGGPACTPPEQHENRCGTHGEPTNELGAFRCKGLGASPAACAPARARGQPFCMLFYVPGLRPLLYKCCCFEHTLASAWRAASM